MASIGIERVVKRYGRAAAVDGVSLEVTDGELMVLVGPSGCGKSTLLRLVAGLERIDEGELRLDGARANDLAPRDRNLGMVFQSYALYPHLTVFENIAFPLRLRRVPEPELRRRVEETAARLDLGALLDRRPAQLSGGQRQRVAMGRALVREARAFLLDEPLSNLDARLRTELRAEIRRLQRALGVTTLHVTHDQTEALTLGDRVAVLRAGRLEQVAPPAALYGRPANLFVAGFVGSPAMNFFPARVEAGALVLPFARAPLPPGRALPPGGAVVAGLRPEHLERAVQGAAGRGGAEASDAPGVTFRARAELVEWLGDRQLLHLPWDAPPGPDLAGAAWRELRAGVRPRLVAALGAEPAVRAGEVIALRFEPARLHLFDPASGAALP